MKKSTALKLILIILLSTLLWFTISYFRKVLTLSKYLSSDRVQKGDIEDIEEYLVYSAVINSQITSNTEIILINSQTNLNLPSKDELKGRKPYLLEFSDETWGDFLTKNTTTAEFGNSFDIKKPYLLFKSNEMEEINIALWDADIDYTPFLEFSRIGFNIKKDEAVVHVSSLLPGYGKQSLTFAYGYFYLLKKVDEKWQVEGKQKTFIT